MASKVSVTGGIAAALGFIPKALGGAWLALLLLTAATAVGYFVELDEENLPIWAGLASAVVAGLIGVMTAAALYRLALSDGADKSGLNEMGPGGLQWSSGEWRLLGANILVGLLQGLMLSLLGVPLVILAVVTKNTDIAKLAEDIDRLLPELLTPNWLSAVQGALGPTLLLVGSALFVVLAFVIAVRFALFAPATIAEKQMVVTSAWSLSAGSTLPLLIGMLLTFAPTFAHAFLAAIYEVDLSLVAGRFGVLLDPRWVSSTIEAAVDAGQVVLTAGFLAHAYRRVAPKREAPLQLGGL